VHDKIDAVFKEVLNVDPKGGAITLVYNETEGWNSVGHMMLVAGLEQAFDCMLEMDDILDMSSYEKVVEIMAKYA
jgi:acyl carrier protein